MPFIIPANTLASGGFEVANSLRFNRGSSDFLNKTLGTPTDIDKATFSTWIKFSDVTSSNDTAIFAATADGNNTTHLEKLGSQVFRLNMREGSSYIGVLTTNRVFRDPSAWFHIVVAFDTTQGTASNRIKLYINGVQETSFSTATYPDQNVDLRINTSGQVFRIGHRGDAANSPDAYFAETVFVDGLQLAADSFGEFDEDSGIWKPIKVSDLTFGDNGSYLEYKQAGTSANASGMGADTSGNTNHFTVNNLTAADQTTDTCTNNFATLNPLGTPTTNTTFSEGNLTVNVASGSSFYSVPTIGVSSGKWYVEGKLVTGTTESGASYSDYGFSDRPNNEGKILNNASGRTFWLSAWDSKINYRTGGSNTVGIQTSKTGLSEGNFFQLYLDMDNELMYWGRNGSVTNSTGISFNGKESLTGEYFFAFADQYTNGTYKYSTNFGQGSIDGSAVTAHNDANGFGNFKYNPSVTTDEGDKDFLALCTKNLAENG